MIFLATVLFIFGPSCGGKSTLSQALAEHLGWIYLDRDLLIEDGLCKEEQADQALEEHIALHRHVVVDAQVPWRAPREDELYVLVHAPLEVLLERDALRTAYFQRSEKRAYYARKYVEETFVEVWQAPVNWGFVYHHMCDSSQTALDTEIAEVLGLLNTFPEDMTQEGL